MNDIYWHMGNMNTFFRKKLWFLVVLALLCAKTAIAENVDFIILGVITSDSQKDGIALVKNKKTGKVSAHQVGSELSTKTILSDVQRRHVTLLINNKPFRLEVGAEVATAENNTHPTNSSLHGNYNSSNDISEEGFERKGDTVRLTETYKENLIKNDLSQILMQAATEPFIKDEKIIGFSLWEIDKGSIYEKAGLINGDVITHINNQPLTDAGLAIKSLNQLRNAEDAVITYLRNGQEMNLNIKIQ